jgi:hypothetical protein
MIEFDCASRPGDGSSVREEAGGSLEPPPHLNHITTVVLCYYFDRDFSEVAIRTRVMKQIVVLLRFVNGHQIMMKMMVPQPNVMVHAIAPCNTLEVVVTSRADGDPIDLLVTKGVEQPFLRR